MMNEAQRKQEQLQSLLANYQLDAIYLQRASSFAWATCGAESFINRAASNGAAALLVTSTDKIVVTDNIEAPRIEKEEKLAELGWKFFISPWHEAQAGMVRLTRGKQLGSDGPFPGALDLSDDIAHLRAQLTPEENERFRELGRRCALAMKKAIEGIRPGQTEYEIQARLAFETEQ